MINQTNVSIISLGGKGEVGSNMIILETNNDIIVLDAGTLFPEDDKYGINLIIPDISYLIENKEKIRGIIFSHGHEDHIGAIPYLLQKINPPLYGSDLTIGLIKKKLKNFGLDKKAKLNIIGKNYNYNTLKLNSFEIEFCHINHSIPASVSMAIKTPVGLIIYTGDYKFDQTPINNPQSDYQKLSDWGKQGVLALLGDSTNAERDGHTLSEQVVAKKLKDSFKLINQRIIIATFSSNIDRIQQIVNAGNKTNRKLAVAGRSMLKTIEIASQLGYLKIPENMLITLNQAQKLEPEEIILLMTGTQGEYRAALTRMARGEHREVKIRPGDTVFLSASPIPGNEKAIGETINMLYKQGARVIYNDMMDIHASGHGCQEELKMMINLTKPKFLIPVHGEFRHLFHHAQLGKQAGIPAENILISENGNKIKLNSKQAKIDGKIKTGKIYIQKGKIIENGKEILRDREKLGKNGFVNIIIPITNNKINGKPVIISRGLIFNKNEKKLFDKLKNNVHKILNKIKKGKTKDWSKLKPRIINNLKDFFYQEINYSPLITIKLIKIK